MFQIGDSVDMLGVYKIIAALQRLMAWAQLEYRPWFEERMVPLTDEQRASLALAQ